MYPYEVVRNSLQSSRRYTEKKLGIRKVLVEIFQSRGIRGFYYGFPVHLLRILPNNAVMFVAYEYLSRNMLKLGKSLK